MSAVVEGVPGCSAGILFLFFFIIRLRCGGATTAVERVKGQVYARTSGDNAGCSAARRAARSASAVNFRHAPMYLHRED